jgi:N-acetylmuramoyl-L-alanine amidase
MVRQIHVRSPMLALAALLTLLAPSLAHAAATASAVRLGIHEEGVTRFVMDLTEAMDFKVSTLADPYRVVIDTSPLDWAAPPAFRKPLGAVSGIEAGQGRIVLDLRSPAAVKNAFVLSPRDGLGWRFVLDLKDVSREAFLAAAHPKPPAPHKPPAKAAALVVKPAPAPVSEAAKPAGATIVVMSPNAPATSLAPAPVAPAPPPAVAAPVPAAAPLPEPKPLPDAKALAEPKPLVEPKPLAVVEPAAARSVMPLPVARPSGPMMSAPMPPPPERPAPPAEPAVAAPTPAVQPAPVVRAAMPVPQPAPPLAKAHDGVPVVVIDPGHGGVDPGATGVSGIYEKYITLAMARELKAVLEKSGRYRVHLTRDRDVFIRLRDRVALARQFGADLFISLHADAVQNAQIRGLSVYTLSQNASDNESQALAEKENKADLIAGIDLSHESADVAGILIDLAQRETMNRSAGFAGELVDEVGHELDLLGNTHRFAGFAVLKAPDVPAVLVEMGYLSNDDEERELRQPQYRVKLAKAVAKAVDRFFAQAQKAKRP